MVDTGLQDKVVLVTGGNHGIGAATAKAFAAQGTKVFINYLRLSPEDYGIGEEEAKGATTPGYAFYRAMQSGSADSVLQEIRDRGGQAEAWEADLAQTDTVSELFDRAERTFGPVDVLINNAAYCREESFLPGALHESAGRVVPTFTPGNHDQHFAVNSRAVALMMAEYARRRIERGIRWGRIINVSTDGASCFPGNISYGASKHAMESYSRSAAMELGPHGITVNIVSLGPVQTGWISPEQEKKELLEIPLGRLGKSEDVADVIVFLASEQARWVTGQLIFVGGGHAVHD